MFVAINLSGFVGTVIPMSSKRLGFDPALTAGPFETAFQDVVGVTILLGLALCCYAGSLEGAMG
jgi:magnesium transporter